MMSNFEVNFPDKFRFTINYDEHITTKVNQNIPLQDPHEFFGPDMLTNLNDVWCQQKRRWHNWS